MYNAGHYHVAVIGAADFLWQLSGKNAGEEIIEQVFSRFCVGK